MLPRYATLTDVEVLALPMPLSLAQEVVATESGYADWAVLRRAAADAPPSHVALTRRRD